MALPAAMVLSGIPQEQFTGQLQGVFNQGSVLLKSPRSASASSSSSSSSSSEPNPSSAGPPEAGSASAASSSSSTQVPSAADTPESGLASSVSTETDRGVDFYLEVILQLEKKFQTLGAYPAVQQPAPEKELKIMYQNRDILDLASNLRSNWDFQYAELPPGVEKFFENRSQLSRLAGAEIPPHRMVPCQDPDCEWHEPVYY